VTTLRSRFPTRRAALALLGVVLALLAASALSVPAEAAARKPTTPPPSPAPTRSFGLSMPTVPGDLAPLTALGTSLQRKPDRVMWYAAWGTGAGFDAAAASRVAATGALPVITWEPWDYTAGTTQPTYSMARIASGALDPYITRWARGIKSYAGPVVLRFAHEMNGSWYPWSAGVNGNTAADYVAAWRHVWSVFAAQKVTNVRWDWSPNVPYPGSTPLASLYPGDGYVDQVSLDGYNWGGQLAGTSWVSFEQVFAAGITEVTALTSEPLYLGEVGAPEAGGDKAAWVRDMFATLAARPEIKGFTWFSHQKEADWRIDSSAASLEAFRTGLATY